MRILIVDDRFVNRSLLNKLLVNTGHDILLAENGQQAVEVFEQEQPDLILMDIMMPVMDGLEAIKKIRSFKAEKQLQILVVSALSDEANIVKGLEAGADDYITKPFNITILNAKIAAIQRMIVMQQALLANQQTLQQYHLKNEAEQEFAENIFEKLIAQSDLNDAQLDFWIKPSKRFSGDLVSAKRVSETQLYFMLADSTGHGLAAALPTIVVNQLFQTNIQKDISVSKVAREINSQLKQTLPAGHFVALAVGMVDIETQTIEIWNGGLPALSVINDNRIVHSFSSKHVFCGILDDDAFDESNDTFSWKENSELFIYSDGLTDVVNQQGEVFGDDQVMDVLLQTKAGERIDGVKHAVAQYLDPSQEQDDISCLVIYCQ